MASIDQELIGKSGCRYTIERLLQGKNHPFSRVYLATGNNQKEKFVVKCVSQSDFDYFQEMYSGLAGCSHLRLLHDTVPEHSIFVYEYLTDDLLGLAQKNTPDLPTKRILKDTLRGLAALHHKNIVHTDIKPNNILVQCEEGSHSTPVRGVQLSDIEDAAYVPARSDIVGKAVGKWMWRSPEAHPHGRVNKPSHIFSFGVVCVYALLKRVIFAIADDELADGEEPLSLVLERQISYFADEDGLNALLNHLGDSPWCEVFKVLRAGFDKSNPRRPFTLWKDVDAGFKDLIAGLTNFDPAKRLTAQEAMAHEWLKDV